MNSAGSAAGSVDFCFGQKEIEALVFLVFFGFCVFFVLYFQSCFLFSLCLFVCLLGACFEVVCRFKVFLSVFLLSWELFFWWLSCVYQGVLVVFLGFSRIQRETNDEKS